MAVCFVLSNCSKRAEENSVSHPEGPLQLKVTVQSNPFPIGLTPSPKPGQEDAEKRLIAREANGARFKVVPQRMETLPKTALQAKDLKEGNVGQTTPLARDRSQVELIEKLRVKPEHR